MLSELLMFPLNQWLERRANASQGILITLTRVLSSLISRQGEGAGMREVQRQHWGVSHFGLRKSEGNTFFCPLGEDNLLFYGHLLCCAGQRDDK
jgi:hypothetical protein